MLVIYWWGWKMGCCVGVLPFCRAQKLLYFSSNFIEVCSQKWTWQFVSIGSGNGLAASGNMVVWKSLQCVRPQQPCSHLGLVTQIYISILTIIGSDNGLLTGRRQAIIWTNAGILLIRPLGTNFCETIFIIFHSRKCIWKCYLKNELSHHYFS